ncbi:MAG: ABC transporter permease [Muribaculaceae bacterium]|nr:ABC transporter permease [Muribaculaceae bacterium]
MSQLGLIIKNEYLTDIRNKSFWIGTFLVPVLMAAFSLFIGFVLADSETSSKLANPAAPDPGELTGMQAMGMTAGIFLALFLMVYGSQIYGKVKKEKTNRVMEVLATCVTGKTMMLGKVISVGLIGLTQLLIWGAMIVFIMVGVVIIFSPDIPWDILSDPRLYIGLSWSFLFFLGGYLFYGAIYAACGAMTDKDNENQAYMTIITFILLGSFYLGEFTVTHPDNIFVIIASFIPFTAPTIAAVNAVAGSVPLWQSVLALLVLYFFAWGSIIMSGKIYTSSLLLKGKKFTPHDILLFLKSK